MSLTAPVSPGHLYGVGLGPGDPGLITRRGAEVIASADVVAFHAGPHGRSTARGIAAELLDARATPAIEELLIYPVTKGGGDDGGYAERMGAFYAEATARLAGHLSAGRSVAVLSLGDPMLYSSYQHLHRALESDFPTCVVPGVPSVTAAAAELAAPLAEGADILSILPATAGRARLAAAARAADCLVIMKLGGHVDMVRDVLAETGQLARARVVVRATMADGWTAPLAEVDAAEVPYFAVVVVGTRLCDGPDTGVRVHGRVEGGMGGGTGDRNRDGDDLGDNSAAASGRGGAGEVVVVGLGPGPDRWLTPEASAELDRVTDVVGYSTYVARVPDRPGRVKHMSDNRVEGERAALALDMAKSGARVAVVSSGDAGVFAMAAAVLETADDPQWREVPVRIVPGMTAAQAVASRVGAPLGHDFAMLSLSDRLKPWEVVEARLRAVLGADMAFAVYNPASKTRRAQIVALRDLVAEYRDADTPVIVARAVGAPEEKVTVTTVADLDPEIVDMRTMLIVGASSTRAYDGVDGVRVFTARHYGGGGFAGTGALGGDR
ncbi:precorrin-3B C(17)-methyltransferase [uncultured Corynebacterium sp.]|uniref:precorrin-3B C(17)-methyltransferase n=1 Tax=uncultured Corynebacterium sp. TaxID=159447 RepID=UPI0025F44370|nr:precorrin-3B C(17)-methyltransferase [uncultured Corynebacterium sp.]